MRTLIAVVVFLAVLYVCISPVLHNIPTALRARRAADVFYFLLAAYAYLLFALLPPAFLTLLRDFHVPTQLSTGPLVESSSLRC